jgi:hypothetical protein
VQVGGSPRDAYQFSLFVFSTIDTYQGTVDMKSLLVRLPCPDAYFFPAPANWQPSQAYFPIDDETCPASPAISASMAEQVFERGRMIWIQSLDVICVLYDDSSRLSEIYPDTWTTGEPDSDPNLVPPSGLLQPMRGFGKVWRENSPVRERLGWASATERPFSSLYQQSWSTYYQRPGDTIFLRDAQGRVLRLYRAYYGRFSMRAWEVVAP